MLRYLTLALVVATSLAHPDYSDTWEEFKQKYEKEYESEDEEVIHRLQITLKPYYFNALIKKSAFPSMSMITKKIMHQS